MDLSSNPVAEVFPLADWKFCKFMALVLSPCTETLQEIGIEGGHACLDASVRYH